MSNIRRPHYAWAVCLAGAIMLFSGMGLGSNLYSVYQPYIIARNGFTNAQAGWIITVRSLFIVLSMFTANRLCSRLGLRRTAVGGMLLLALSRFVFGAARSLPVYLGAAALTGLAYGWAGMIPLSLLINRWFQDRNAFALGLASAGSGLATILLPGPVTWLLQNRGLRQTFWAEAVFVLVLAKAVDLLVRDDPARLGLSPYTRGGPSGGEAAPPVHPAPGGMTPLYWGLYLAAVFLTGAPTAIGMSNVGVLYTTEGFDSATVAALVSCVGIALMAGKMLYGWLADRLGGRRSSLLLYGVSLLSYVLLCLAPNGSRPCAFAAVLTFGLGLPLSNVSFSVWARDFLGDEGFSKGLKWSQTLYAVGIVALGPVPGWLADLTGGYVASYGLFLAMIADSFLFILLVYRRTGSGGRPTASPGPSPTE